MAVAPHPEEKAPASRLRRSLIRLMRGRVSRRVALRALAIEQHLTGARREPGTTSYAENVIHALGKAAGDHVLGETQHTLDRLARKTDGLRAKQASLRTRAGYVAGNFVTHPDGGVRTIADTAGDQDQQPAARAGGHAGPADRRPRPGSRPGSRQRHH